MKYISVLDLSRIAEQYSLPADAEIWEDIREASVDLSEWKNPKDSVPPKKKVVLAVINGSWNGLMFARAMVFAEFHPSEGWQLNHYPECREFDVLAWMDLPELPEEELLWR
ncbi:MAG: hypothetical protein IJ137_11000 [Eubacterium sp.]|nr:hypothetical protein [Eubacterium sp.]